ncbi:Uncharacterized protein dnm_045400 [Desulfonema magnum]|uniref:Uncharacterized protein n=1 Tax=Desulfonema magnum TaxID=45655 RepID=A0A975BMZ4_9BACT|nr:Uncharacterized protein dnm_045400 [Desulfonema magnum]
MVHEAEPLRMRSQAEPGNENFYAFFECTRARFVFISRSQHEIQHQEKLIWNLFRQLY